MNSAENEVGIRKETNMFTCADEPVTVVLVLQKSNSAKSAESNAKIQPSPTPVWYALQPQRAGRSAGENPKPRLLHVLGKGPSECACA